MFCFVPEIGGNKPTIPNDRCDPWTESHLLSYTHKVIQLLTSYWLELPLGTNAFPP